MMWLVLICASFFELAFTVCMKLSNGLKNVKFTVLTVLHTQPRLRKLSKKSKELVSEICLYVLQKLNTHYLITPHFSANLKTSKLLFVTLSCLPVQDL